MITIPPPPPACRGDHTESYSSVRMSVMESRLVDDEDEEASEDDFEKQPMRESDV